MTVTVTCRFRVWDYPVREMYTNMFKVIRQNDPVETAMDGFMRVEEATKGRCLYDVNKIVRLFTSVEDTKSMAHSRVI